MIRHRIKRTIVSQVLASIFALGVPVAALAQADGSSVNTASTQQTAMDSRFRALDANNDGYVSRAEFDAHRNQATNATIATSANGTAAAQQGLAGKMKASKLIGMEVRSSAGRDIGEIEDLLVDVNSGKIRSAVVSMGGIADFGDKLFRYPLSSFSRSSQSDQLVLNVSDGAMRAAKGFDRSNWNFDGTDQGSASHQGLWQASRLLGRDIADRNDDHLGEIKDLVIDGRSGQVQSVLMRYDRPWSLDNPLVSVPLQSLRFAGDHQTISMNVDRHDVDTQRTAAGNASPDVWVERWFVLVPENASGAKSDVAGNFDRLDANRDGVLSQSEYQAGNTSLPSFGAADKNASNTVTRDEFASLHQTTGKTR